MFALLGLIWGSSFLWIKVGLGNGGAPVFGLPMPDGAGFPPLLLVTMRLTIGALGLVALMVARRQSFPREPRVLAASALVGLLNTALPFALITWGETRIPSGLASILNGTVPLFAIVIAHFVLADEPFTLVRLAGLVAGFVGVVVIVGGGIAGPGGVWGALAVLAAALSYAVAAAYSRRVLRGQAPLVQSSTTVSFAAIFLAVAVLIWERPVHWASAPVAWVAVIWLGLLGSCVAYLLYFSLINAWGATRATVVTYVFPVVGLLLGIGVLGEPLDWRLVVGTVLIVGGIVVVNGASLRKALVKA